jgi:hypothetical protein
MISFKGRGVVLVDEAEIWFRSKYTQSANHSRIYPAIEEPNEIFDLIANEFDIALEFEDGGRMTEMTENTALEDTWVSEAFLEQVYGGQ